MNLIQYISFSLEKAVEMLMDGRAGKMDAALCLMDLIKTLDSHGKEIVDVDFEEAGARGIGENG